MSRRSAFKWIGGWAIVSALILVGVTSLVSRSGDFGAFLIEEVCDYGGRTNTNSSLPEIDARWKVHRDRNGFEVMVFHSSFPAVDGFMRKAFGNPMYSGISDGNAKGLPFSNWAARDIGVAIISIGYSNKVQITCVRGVSGPDEMVDEMAKPWYKKIRLW